MKLLRDLQSQNLYIEFSTLYVSLEVFMLMAEVFMKDKFMEVKSSILCPTAVIFEI